MGEIEKAVALAKGYSDAKDALLLEEMILAAMAPRESEGRTEVMAQAGRVEALKRVVAMFKQSLPFSPSTTEGEV